MNKISDKAYKLGFEKASKIAFKFSTDNLKEIDDLNKIQDKNTYDGKEGVLYFYTSPKDKNNH